MKRQGLSSHVCGNQKQVSWCFNNSDQVVLLPKPNNTISTVLWQDLNLKMHHIVT